MINATGMMRSQRCWDIGRCWAKWIAKAKNIEDGTDRRAWIGLAAAPPTLLNLGQQSEKDMPSLAAAAVGPERLQHF